MSVPAIRRILLKICNCAVFEAVHGLGARHRGKKSAQPNGAAAGHLGEHAASTQIRNPLERRYRHPEKLMRDVGRKAGTSQFADELITEMQSPQS